MNAKRISVSAMRPRLMFEVASEMVVADDWLYRQGRLTMRDQGGDLKEEFTFVGTQDPGVIDDVERGDVHISMLNPSAMLTLAYRGKGPFDRPRAVRPIAIIPSYDQLAFAVTPETGVTSLDEIREKRVPLRVSVRGILDRSTAMLADEVLKAHGFSLDDIQAWGGKVSYDNPLPNDATRLGAVEEGKFDAIFDEAVQVWVNQAAGKGMRFLPLDDTHLYKLEADGFRRGVLEKARYPNLPADVPTLDFSGWPIYTHAEAPDSFVRAFCVGLEARRDRITWETGNDDPLPLERMCVDAVDAPLDVPLHPAAEQFWREQGYLA